MSELRSYQNKQLSNGEGSVLSPGPRLLRGLRTFLDDVRVAWRDPTLPAATPALRDYPIHRP